MSAIHPIKAYRQRQKPKVSQQTLAGRIGVTRFTVLRWESGNPIEVEKLKDVTRETGIPAKELRPDLAEQFANDGAQQ